MRKWISFLVGVTTILCLSFVYAKEGYIDVPKSHWAYDAIDMMSNYNILNGYPDGSFKPEGYVTRAELAKILRQTILEDDYNKDDAQNAYYEDVSKNHWAYSYINDMRDCIPGGNNLYFYPDDYATREDVAVGLVKMLEMEDKAYSGDILDIFLDKKFISESAEKCVALAVQNGFMKGNPDRTFNPKGYLKRSEVAQVLYNAIHIAMEKAMEENQEGTSGDSGEGYHINIDFKMTDDTDEKIEAAESETVTPTKKTTLQDISLTVTMNDRKLNEGNAYALDNSKKLSATIENAYSGPNYLYYMISYGRNYAETITKKVSGEQITIVIPQEITDGTLKLTIWGSSKKDSKTYVTDTQTYYFGYKYKDAITLLNEEEIRNYDGTLDFIAKFDGEILENNEHISYANIHQRVTLRGIPVKEIKKIYYRWDNNEYEMISGASGTVTIPDTFRIGEKHTLTVKACNKEGKNSDVRKYSVSIGVE